MRGSIRSDFCLLAVLVLAVMAVPAAATQERESPAGACETCGDQQSPKPGQPAPQRSNERQPQREPEGRPVNLQIEVAITDQIESQPAEKKIVSMVVVDRAWGRVRASGVAQRSDTPGPVSVRLNVDARPTVQANDSIRLELTLEYEPLPASPSPVTGRPSLLHETLTVLLQPGKPLTVSRAVDPFTNRRTSVDVTVTLMK